MNVIFWNSNAAGQQDRRQMFSRYLGTDSKTPDFQS